ncbi:ORFIII-like polyprotein, partial [Tanacetum coccineum]
TFVTCGPFELLGKVVDITPIEEVAATGWGDEFSDDEVTPGKVTILEESDWDDDERSGGEILVIQERLAQNQQEFLDEYLPQWDENLAIQKKESESKWENPFAAKSGENHNHTILHLSKEENDDDDLPYPKFRNFKQMAAQIIKKHEEHAFPSSSSQQESTQSYQPPHDAIMGPPVYPPAQQNPQPFYRPDYQFGYPQGKSKIFNGGYGEYYNSQWTLPPAWTESGVMLVLPSDPGLWSEVISRWESITLNRLNNQTWSDNKAKLAFVENLLGESEKLMWQQWRTAYPNAYAALEAIADEPQNITSQVRQLILLEDPYRGSTDEQDRAYRDLDRITCEDTKNLWSFLEDFRQLATKSGRLYFPSTTEKLFAKLPPSLSKKIEESFRAKHPGLSSGVLPAIKKGRAFCKRLRSIPGKHCKISCFIQELDLDDSLGFSVSDKILLIAVFTASQKELFESDDDDEEEDNQFGHHAFMFHPGPPTKIAEMVQSVGSWKPNKELPVKSKDCEHEWNENTVTNYTICYFCGILTTDTSRLNCPKCQLTTCALCARNYLDKTVNVKRKQPQKQEEEKNFNSNSNEVNLLKELLKEKTEQVQQMIRDQAKEYYEEKAAMQKKEEIWQLKESSLVRDISDALKIIDQLRIEKEELGELIIEKKRLEEQKDEEIRKLKAQLQKKEEEAEVQFPKEEFPPLGSTHVAKPCVETEVHYFGNATTVPKIRKVTNQLYNVKVEFDIPNCKAFGTTAIIDTGASACCINKRVIPEEALEPLNQTVVFNGLNSSQQATDKVKQGYFQIEGNKFKIPLIYAFDMRDSNGIEMLIGANFLRSMKGGIRIEGDEITIYKKVTKIKTSNQTEIAEIAELEVLKQQGYIGEETPKPGKMKGELCKLDIINPDVTIEDKPLKHVTPAMEDLFRKHGTKPIDPATGREVKGKERMVAMDEESIPWTAFLVPGGLYEWLVMPFGLKNAPAVFQRKMDKCFRGTESFIAVYIDDILVFSKNEKDHAKHLEKMLKICEDNGLVLSPTKMKIAVSTVDFLGAVIGEGTIKLQPHIIKKIVNFNEEELKTKKGLRSFLGILNYARTHIPKLGILLRPLYEKTNAHGDKRLKTSDYELVRKIKEQVQNLPDLEIPPENAYIILETDGYAVTGTGVKINIEHIEGKHNTLADSLSRLVNLCFAGCTGEMKELTAAALYSVEEVLQSPNTFQKNMKTTCEEVMKISNHFLESSQKLSSHLKNQEHYTNVTSSRPTKPQSEWINLMHGDQSLKTLNFKQQKKQLKPCDNYDAINNDDDAINDDNKYRYNRKGFLEDDERNDDSIFIVDPGWDDYSLQAIKSNRPIYSDDNKIVNFNEEELKTKKGLRKDKEQQVQNLSDWIFHRENAYIILETDGCMEGWGGYQMEKAREESNKEVQKECVAYASGKFSTTQSTIDAEINACINWRN